jgi:hypothetical protein
LVASGEITFWTNYVVAIFVELSFDGCVIDIPVPVIVILFTVRLFAVKLFIKSSIC